MLCGNNKKIFGNKTILTNVIEEINLNKNYIKTKNERYSLGSPNHVWINELRKKGLSLDDYIKSLKNILVKK